MQAHLASFPPAKAKSPPKREGVFVIFGRDTKGKPHAASFTADEGGAAEQAAKLMGYVAWLVPEAARPLAAKVPAGVIFGSGKARASLVSRKLMAQLEAAAGPALKPGNKPTPTPAVEPARAGAAEAADGPSSPAGGTPARAAPPPVSDSPKRPASWGDIGIGCEVLADSGVPSIGWFEAVVLRQPDTDLFELEWRFYPEEPQFVRRRDDLALLSPNHVWHRLA